MTLLEQYAIQTKKGEEIWAKCVRRAGPFTILPTKRGDFVFRCLDRDVKSDMSIKELREVRDLINDFLKNVVGESND